MHAKRSQRVSSTLPTRLPGEDNKRIKPSAFTIMSFCYDINYTLSTCVNNTSIVSLGCAEYPTRKFSLTVKYFHATKSI